MNVTLTAVATSSWGYPGRCSFQMMRVAGVFAHFILLEERNIYIGLYEHARQKLLPVPLHDGGQGRMYTYRLLAYTLHSFTLVFALTPRRHRTMVW